jgi:hypothetical protein
MTMDWLREVDIGYSRARVKGQRQTAGVRFFVEVKMRKRR